MEIKPFYFDFLRVREFEKAFAKPLQDFLTDHNFPKIGAFFTIFNCLILCFSMFISLDRANFFDIFLFTYFFALALEGKIYPLEIQHLRVFLIFLFISVCMDCFWISYVGDQAVPSYESLMDGVKTFVNTLSWISVILKCFLFINIWLSSIYFDEFGTSFRQFLKLSEEEYVEFKDDLENTAQVYKEKLEKNFENQVENIYNQTAEDKKQKPDLSTIHKEQIDQI